MFSETAPSANPVFFRTYSRKNNNNRESFEETTQRVTDGLSTLGKLTKKESQLIYDNLTKQRCFPSGRWLWVGGTKWSEVAENFPGAYNCSSTNVNSWAAFGYIMDLAMQGCGTGAVLEKKYILKLPKIITKLNVNITHYPGDVYLEEKRDETILRQSDKLPPHNFNLTVGDSRQGWVQAYELLLRLASNYPYPEINLFVNLAHVRKKGEPLKGFGGVANPSKLPELFIKVADILNNAVGRKLNAVECALIINEAALVVVAGNIRRSANIQQGDANDELFTNAKDNLWQQDEHGNWSIDPKRDALRMANLTRVFHQKPTLQECIDSVRKQYYSGEGAIQYATEAVVRANADLLLSPSYKAEFRHLYESNQLDLFFKAHHSDMPLVEQQHRGRRYGLNPCGEIIMSDNFCNLSEVHLNNIEASDYEAQKEAFQAAALSVAALLHHQFTVERYQYSRAIDPIVGVSFTGLFDFFVNALGIDWLKWWEEGRPNTEIGEGFKNIEKTYLELWRNIVENTVWDYCDRHGLRRPNRCTTVQPSGTKSLLTGASPGWHPPKAQRFIRRITFAKDDPVALACLDYGYNVVPAQSDRDENGNLLNDPFDPRCTEWLVEIPTEVPWANLEGADKIEVNKFSALAQFDFYMQVQQHYTTHNTSATIEFGEHEIEPLATAIYNAIQNDEGYISAALLARFESNQTFPRLPFEPISKAVYSELQRDVLARRKSNDFLYLLNQYDAIQSSDEFLSGPAPCDSDKCLFSAK